MAREASTLSLVTCHAGFSRRGIDPVGETSNVPDTPLGSRHLLFSPPPSANRRHPWSSQTKSRRSNQNRKRPSKSRARSLPVPVPASSAALNVINPDAAGIDVHSNMHMVCVPADRDADPVRQFGANTADLQEIVAWLKKCGVKTVALESTGVYWIPLFELLESEGFEVNLVEPGQLSRCGARPKTDVLDAQWIQRLHSYGLLRASFRPPDSVLALRAYWRQRQMQVRYAASHVQHMQKAMEQMNVKLTEVVSDITGLTGMSIIDAILEGATRPASNWPNCGMSAVITARSRLPSRWKERGGPNISSSFGRRTSCTSSIIDRSPSATSRLKPNWRSSPTGRERRLRLVKPRKRGRKSNDVRFEATGPLFQALGVDLTLIEGIDVGTALVILAEIGVDVSRFPTEKHFASWLRLCPPQDESNKTKRTPRSSQGHQPSHHRLADGRAVGGQDNDAVGPVLPPDPQSDRWTRSRQGDRAQVGVFGLQDAQVRRGVRDPVDGRVRGQDEGQYVEGAAAEGGGDGLPTQSADPTQ